MSGKGKTAICFCGLNKSIVNGCESENIMNYFNNKPWDDISREERFYCASLYFEVRDSKTEFAHWLIDAVEWSPLSTPVTKNGEWDVGYEVCFFRDLSKQRNANEPYHGSLSKSMLKRTFDLCLFSSSVIIVIEAKVQQGFKKNQIKSFDTDRAEIKKLTGGHIDVKYVALASKEYFDRHKRWSERNKPKSSVLDVFDARLTWAKVYDKFKNPLYNRADGLYNK